MKSGSMLLLTDYRGFFYISTVRRNATDLDKLRSAFAQRGISVEIRSFADIDFRREQFAGIPVLYQSSEDQQLIYKDYIEDILLGLEQKGARLIPPFRFFRAHHNKVFMEILRDISGIPELQTMHARVFGTFEDFLARANSVGVPAVLKPSAGAGSQGVQLARTDVRKVSIARRISRSVGSWSFAIRDLLAPLKYREYRRASLHRAKFVVQPFVENLTCDYKVLVFGPKFYVLQRGNRAGDFRASGSGLFSWPTEPPSGMLDFCSRVFAGLKVPYLSLDVAYDGSRFHVLEFQFLSFGPLTMERSPWHFVREGNQWVSVKGPSVLEEEIAASVAIWLRNESNELV